MENLASKVPPLLILHRQRLAGFSNTAAKGGSPGFVRRKKFTAFSMHGLLSLDLNEDEVLMHHLRPFLDYFAARQGPTGSLTLMPGKALSKDSLPVPLPIRYSIILQGPRFWQNFVRILAERPEFIANAVQLTFDLITSTIRNQSPCHS